MLFWRCVVLWLEPLAWTCKKQIVIHGRPLGDTSLFDEFSFLRVTVTFLLEIGLNMEHPWA